MIYTLTYSTEPERGRCFSAVGATSLLKCGVLLQRGGLGMGPFSCSTCTAAASRARAASLIATSTLV